MPTPSEPETIDRAEIAALVARTDPWSLVERDALEARLSTRCEALLDRPHTVKALARYHWWPQAA